MPAYTGQVRLTGIDQPGLLYRLTDVLTEHNLNIEHLQTEQHVRTGSAPQLFTTHCVVSGAVSPNVPKLKAALKGLSDQLGVVCTVEPKKRRLSSIKSMTSGKVPGKPKY